MKLFISLNISGPKELLLHQELVQELKRLGISVWTSIDLKKGNLEGTHFEELDALVIDGTALEADAGYLLALGLAHKKQVLYLLAKGSILDSSVEALTHNKEVKKHIKIVFYSPDSLIKKVKAFLQYLDENIGQESYTIKYTLRLSPRLDRYLVWKSKQIKKDKADLFREWLNESMQKDEEYQKRLE
jgi:hypothetical protein